MGHLTNPTRARQAQACQGQGRGSDGVPMSLPMLVAVAAALLTSHTQPHHASRRNDRKGKKRGGEGRNLEVFDCNLTFPIWDHQGNVNRPRSDPLKNRAPRPLEVRPPRGASQHCTIASTAPQASMTKRPEKVARAANSRTGNNNVCVRPPFPLRMIVSRRPRECSDAFMWNLLCLFLIQRVGWGGGGRNPTLADQTMRRCSICF